MQVLSKTLRRATAGLLMLSASSLAAQDLAGPYLAASQADIRGDFDDAARYYTLALVQDPKNPEILQRAMVAQMNAGDVDTAILLVRQLDAAGIKNQLTHLTQISDAFRRDDFDKAQTLADDESVELNGLLRGLLQGWAAFGAGKFSDAEAAFDALNANDGLRVYGQYHKALALALTGDAARAEAMIAGADGAEPLYINTESLIAHAQLLVVLDRRDDAVQLLDRMIGENRNPGPLTALRARIEAGEEVEFDVINSAAQGASQATLLLAGALSREQADRLALVYSRLAQHMDPTNEESFVLAGDLLRQLGQFDLASKEYARVKPASPLFESAEIGRAESLHAAERSDEAVEVLSSLARERPDNLAVFISLGDIQRAMEDFVPASEAYTTALSLTGEELQQDWVLYYSRGITFERTDRWDQAEADFRKALELQPDQPLVLNYLGYSLVELGRNYDEALDMIEKAVEQRPNDGYITDSLGWILYRLGRFDEAVEPMERAVELTPVDPIINDHLGDVYWKVGRTREAEFQWRRALSFEPEEDEAIRIRRKLEVGLDAVLSEEAGETPIDTTVQDG